MVKHQAVVFTKDIWQCNAGINHKVRFSSIMEALWHSSYPRSHFFMLNVGESICSPETGIGIYSMTHRQLWVFCQVTHTFHVHTVQWNISIATCNWGSLYICALVNEIIHFLEKYLLRFCRPHQGFSVFFNQQW